MTPRLAVVPELETELDRLYALPPEEFIAARNELTSRLRKAGQKEAAESVRALRKPSIPVWAVNQLARLHRKEMDALVDAGERLRRAQERAFAGEGGEGVRATTADERAAIRALTKLGERLLAAESRPATKPTLERIAGTLRAAAVDPAASALLVAGRLPDEVESPGFSALASLAPPRRRGKTRRADERVDLAARREHEQRVRRLQKRVEQLRRKEAEAARKAERAERAAVDARAAADAVRSEADAAESELADAAAETPK
jgi:hypothetical protein